MREAVATFRIIMDQGKKMKSLKEILYYNYVQVGDDGHCLFDLGDMITDRETHTFLMREAVELLQIHGYSCFTPIAWIEDDRGQGYFTRPVNSFYAFDPQGEVARIHLPQQGKPFTFRSGGRGRPGSRNP